MAIHRGIQSAIFFYLSCAPCADARCRKKRRQEAVWNRAERDALEEEMPDAYRHPEPSSTNPYWHSEIVQGPTGRKAKNGGRKSPGDLLSSNVSVVGGSSLDLLQREDEKLWGEGGLHGATIQRPQRAMRIRGRSNETNTTVGTSYSNFRSPPVSDLLPPIVRTVQSREEIAWMMQPPPVADVMSGKTAPRSVTSSRQTSTRMARTISRESCTSSSLMMSVGDSPRSLPLDRRPSRPPLLSTIASEGNVPTQVELSLVDSGTSQSKPLRPKYHTRADSDSKQGRVLKGRIFTATDASSSPSASSPSDGIYTAEGEVRPELFDSWYTPDFELGRWVHENTRREGVRERWSFDV